MIVLSVLIEILMILLTKRLVIDSKTNKIIIIYILIEMNLMIISMTNPIGLYSVSSKVYILWIINVFIFVGVLILKSNKRKEISNILISENTIEKILKSKIILYGQMVLFLVLLFYSYKFNSVVNSIGDASQIRMAKFTFLFGSYIETIFYNYVIVLLYKTMIIITSILIVNKKIKNPITILGLINLMLYSTIGYGRMNLYEFLLFILFAYIICSSKEKKFKLNLKSLIRIATIIIIIFSIGLIVTAVRLGIEITDFNKIYNIVMKKQIEQLITYFIGGFRALDIFLENGFNSIGKYTLGRATFAGIDEMIEIFLTVLGKEYSSFNSIVGLETQANIIIGNNISFNAFYTCLMNYTSDFGYFGVIIYPLLYGNLVYYCLKNEIKNKSIISKILLIYVLMNTISTIYRWNYQFGETIFILIIYIIANKIKIKKKQI